METLSKTFRKIQEMQETMGKEFAEVTERNEAVAKLAAIAEIRGSVDRDLKAYEAFNPAISIRDLSFTTDGAKKQIRLDAEQKIAAGICTLLEYAKQNPLASADDLKALSIELPVQMDISTIVLIGRCARIAQKYEDAKPGLTKALLNLVTKPVG
ncbi:MAG: hypothetical protein GYA23_01905 [Methanomicrobiales archaeon]|nr:hypothetical protein [Methanomicrobiales archaeon]